MMFLMSYFRTFLAWDWRQRELRCLPFSDEVRDQFIMISPNEEGARLEGLCDHVSIRLDEIVPERVLQGYTLRDKNNKFLSAEPLGNVCINRDSAGPWEKFAAVTQENALRFLQLYQNPQSEIHRFAARVQELRMAGSPMSLYFGAGKVPRVGFLNFDLFVMAPEFAAQHSDDYFTFPFADAPWPIPDNSIDYIFHEDFLEHIPQIMQWQFLAECLRVLKPGAYHRVNTPCIKASMVRHSDFKLGNIGVYTGEREHEHVAMLTHSSLKEMAEAIGYSEVVFTRRHQGISPYAVDDFRPGPDRDEVNGNIYADLKK